MRAPRRRYGRRPRATFARMPFSLSPNSRAIVATSRTAPLRRRGPVAWPASFFGGPTTLCFWGLTIATADLPLSLRREPGGDLAPPKAAVFAESIARDPARLRGGVPPRDRKGGAPVQLVHVDEGLNRCVRNLRHTQPLPPYLG